MSYSMRRPEAAGAAAILMVTLACAPGCRRRHVTAETDEGQGTALATMVHVADPRTAPQLLSGFYGVESNAWRWTAGRFAVVLRPPRTAAQNGAILQLRLTVPAPVIEKLKVISLSASVGGVALAPESYTQAGPYTYSRDVPASALGGDSARVDFSVDKTMPPTPSDRRELGVVVTTVGFQAK
jgi:hypothetical protein